MSDVGPFMKKYSFKARQACSVVEATTEMDQTKNSPAEKSAALRELFLGHREAKPAVEFVVKNYFNKPESK